MTGLLRAGSTLERRKVDRRVLASSIDLDIELQTVSFIETGHARTLNGADVDECVRLAVIARNETEALHRIEELDRTGRLFASKLALRCHFTLLYGDHITNDRKVTGRDLAATINELEFQLLPFGEPFESGTFNSADVHEDIVPAFIALDKTEALGCIEELYDAAALADDLGRHAAAATAATAAAARATAEAATARSTTTVIETAAAATAKAISTAEAVSSAKTVSSAEAILSGKEGIELVLSKPIPLVASPSATTSIKTHV